MHAPAPDDRQSGGDLAGLRIDKSRTAVRRSRFRWRYLLILLFLALGAGLWWAGVFTPRAEVRLAVAAPYHPSQAYTLLNASGYVVPQLKAAVGTKITSRLIELTVEEGDRVREGQVVARLEGEDLASALDTAESEVRAAQFLLKEAEARLYEASLTYRRMRELFTTGAVARSELDAAKAENDAAEALVKARAAQLETARRNVAQARVNVEYTRIVAPFDAVVLTKDADVGDIVTPLGAAANAKASVVTIADLDSLQVEADVAESNIAEVRKGQDCVIQLDALPGERFGGWVHMIVPTADRSKASVLVKVAFDRIDPRILPEMSAKVAFLSRPVAEDEKNPVLAVPTAALTAAEGGEAKALVAGNGTVRAVRVTTGRNFGDLTEILSGLRDGDKVVVSPPEGLKDGDPVKVAE